jgi:hypothetical protein
LHAQAGRARPDWPQRKCAQAGALGRHNVDAYACCSGELVRAANQLRLMHPKEVQQADGRHSEATGDAGEMQLHRCPPSTFQKSLICVFASTSYCAQRSAPICCNSARGPKEARCACSKSCCDHWRPHETSVTPRLPVQITSAAAVRWQHDAPRAVRTLRNFHNPTQRLKSLFHKTSRWWQQLSMAQAQHIARWTLLPDGRRRLLHPRSRAATPSIWPKVRGRAKSSTVTLRTKPQNQRQRPPKRRLPGPLSAPAACFHLCEARS